SGRRDTATAATGCRRTSPGAATNDRAGTVMRLYVRTGPQHRGECPPVRRVRAWRPSRDHRVLAGGHRRGGAAPRPHVPGRAVVVETLATLSAVTLDCAGGPTRGGGAARSCTPSALSAAMCAHIQCDLVIDKGSAPLGASLRPRDLHQIVAR